MHSNIFMKVKLSNIKNEIFLFFIVVRYESYATNLTYLFLESVYCESAITDVLIWLLVITSVIVEIYVGNCYENGFELLLKNN